MSRSEINSWYSRFVFLLMYNVSVLAPMRDVLGAKTLHDFWRLGRLNLVGIPLILYVMGSVFVYFQVRKSLSPQMVAEAEKSREIRRSMGWKSIAFTLLKINALSLGAGCVFAYGDRPATSPLHLGHYALCVFVATIWVTVAQVWTLWRLDRITLTALPSTFPATE